MVIVSDANMARMGPKGGPVYSHTEWTESSLHKIQVRNFSSTIGLMRKTSSNTFSLWTNFLQYKTLSCDVNQFYYNSKKN